MIIIRSPLRITLGGGGTDLPSYYEKYGGMVLSAAINKYVYVSLNRTFTDEYFLKYSEIERVNRIEDIQHPIIREAFRLHDVPPAIEIVSLADIPAGTGLGSSGTFTVGLLRALYLLERVHVTAGNLAEEACKIEIEFLNRAVGKQDQYIAAFGGLTCFEFETDGHVRVSPLMISTETLHDLEEHLLLFFTGYARNAESVLSEQRDRSIGDEDVMISNLHTARELGAASREALEQGDTGEFAEIMHTHWLNKKQRSSAMSNPNIDKWYEMGKANGAIGGKVVGAGGGGFLLFYTRKQDELRKAFAKEGLQEVRFTFDFVGASPLASS